MSNNYLHIDRQSNSDNIALFDADQDRSVTYYTLCEEIERLSKILEAEQKSLVFHLCTNSTDAIIAYLSAVGAGHAVALLDSRLSGEKFLRLLELYDPEWVICPVASRGAYAAALSAFSDSLTYGSLSIHRKSHPSTGEIAPEVMLLLTTSGSTGSPKFVRLSRQNLEANARAISHYLGIETDHRAIMSLPIHYSYGLSVVNSHLYAGASLVVTDKTLMEQSFWDVFTKFQCSSFAGVPYSYAILERIGFAKNSYPALRYMTQAGGKLEDRYVRRYYELMLRSNKRFYVMYGQTEASPRISYLPFESIPDKIGSVGVAIPGGSVTIFDSSTPSDDHGSGEIVYRGPNVMLGYATCRAQLAHGDELQGVLYTGDTGYVDDDGYLYVTGRNRRIGKAYGVRLNLDEVESFVRRHGQAAVISHGADRIAVFCEFQTSDNYAAITRELAGALSTHWSVFDFHFLESIPTNAVGKIDYRELESCL